MSRLVPFATLTLLGLLLTALGLPLTGCNQSSALDAKTLATFRTQLALAEEPDAIQTLFDIRETLLGDTSHAEHDHEGHDDHDHGDDHGHAHHDHPPSSAAVAPIQASIVGHIGGLANPWKTTQRDFPFDTTQAVFFLADPQALVENEASGHSHAPGEECAFCAHAADNSDKLAMVQLVDSHGNILPVDARQLFDIKEKDTVVVSGTARIAEGGMMVIQATGLYVRK